MSDDGWTVEVLRAHVGAIFEERDKRYDQRFNDLDMATKAALAASEKAVNKAENAMERRFEGVNEFRSTLSDQASQFMTRLEAVAAIERNSERIQELTDRLNRSEGKGAGLNAGWAYLIAGVTVIAAVVGIILGVTR
ncbi:hypothetical protein [Streptomyces sp. NRRL S-920]|uniref:hypothetical protein n=1 Tax=Streptomyces sp. NRRL S-920 TaxID=1463921 RepID=UPI000B0B6C63|nr:hypothetical protein [Streptomyces sp. NRRL S-920]